MRWTLHLDIKGRVQGVGYRQWFASSAIELDLRGWVRNRQDGSVEAVVSGVEPAVNSLLVRMRRGPRLAVVTAVEIREIQDEGWPDFLIRNTA